MKISSGIVGISVAVIVVSFAFVAGQSLGDYFNKKQEDQSASRRSDQTERLLIDHIQLGAGDTLPDQAFETLVFDTVRLSEVLSDRSVLVAVLPGCGSCLEEMGTIAEIQAARDLVGPFVFVSSGNPRELAAIRDSLGLANPFLYDHRGAFLSQFGIDIYPMCLTVSRTRELEDILIGSLLPSEIETVLNIVEKRRHTRFAVETEGPCKVRQRRHS